MKKPTFILELKSLPCAKGAVKIAKNHVKFKQKPTVGQLRFMINLTYLLELKYLSSRTKIKGDVLFVGFKLSNNNAGRLQHSF